MLELFYWYELIAVLDACKSSLVADSDLLMRSLLYESLLSKFARALVKDSWRNVWPTNVGVHATLV